jgi:predicted amidohydrolase
MAAGTREDGGMRVAIIQLAYDDDERADARVERVAQLVREQAGHDLVVLPELWQPTGFGYRRWAELAEPVDGPLVHSMARAARAAGVVLHAGSWIETNGAGPDGRGLWNTSMVFGPDGSLLATYRKVHRFGFGQGEPVLLEAGPGVVKVDLPLPLPTGEGESRSVTTGLATCYDLRFPEQFRLLLDAGATLFVVPAAWPAARVGHWQLLGRARAIENQAFMVQCNTAGTHAGVEMGGHSQVVDPWGVVVAEAGAGEEVLSVEIDIDSVAGIREKFPVLADRRL